MEVIIAYAAFIFIAALPLIVISGLIMLPFGALALWFYAFKQRSISLFIAGIFLFSVSIMAGNFALSYFLGGDTAADPDLGVKPEYAMVVWHRQVPRKFVTNWDQFTPLRLVAKGVVDVILRPTKRAAGNRDRSEQWEAVTVKGSDICQKGFRANDANLLFQNECIAYQPTSKPIGDYIFMAETAHRHPKDVRITSIYFVHNGTKQLFGTCSAEYPVRPLLHSSLQKLRGRKDNTISAKYGQCRRAMLDKIASLSLGT
jgi:hypothetical protein